MKDYNEVSETIRNIPRNIRKDDNMITLKEDERVQSETTAAAKKRVTVEIKVETKELDSAIEKVKELKQLLGDIGIIKQERAVNIRIDGMFNGNYVDDVVKAVSEQLKKAIGTKAEVIIR